MNCLGCGNPLIADRRFVTTCSAECHETFITRMEERFGTHKRITSLETGLTHLIPTRVIVERGIRSDELTNYPLADD